MSNTSGTMELYGSNNKKKEKEEASLDSGGSSSAAASGSSTYGNAVQNALEASGSGNSGSVSQSDSSSSSYSDYDDLRNQNYKNLLDNQIQLEAARQSALKASNSQLASQGLLGTGYGSTARSGISNAYINAMNNANTSYSETDNDISKQETSANEEKANSNFTTLTSLMGQATDSDDLNSVLSEYGITVNDDGTFSGEYYDSMDDETKKQFGVTYRLLANGMKYSGQTSYGDYSSMIAGLTMTNGESANIGNNKGLQDEVALLFDSDYSDQFNSEGTVVKLSNGNDKDNVAFVIYHNGKWYAATSGDYATAKSKREIKGGKLVS